MVDTKLRSVPVFTNIDDEVLHAVAKTLGGEEAVTIVKAMSDGKEITVEELALKTRIHVNTVRKVLYKLYNHSLVNSRRFRDSETGWFIFQWSLQQELVEGFVQSMKRKILKKLQDRLDYERNHQFYHCGKPEDPKLSFEQAMEQVFHCPKCGEVVHFYDNHQIVEVLEDRIRRIEGELSY